MKIKHFQSLLLILSVAVILSSCGSNDEPVFVGPYIPITEGKVFLPVLVEKPDMEKIKQVEATRKGVFVSKETLKDNYERHEEHQYTFTYTDMDFSEVIYCVSVKDGRLLRVIMNHKDNSDVKNRLDELAKKNGFNNDNYLALLKTSLTIDKYGLFSFRVEEHKDINKIMFRQYGKQTKDMPTLKGFHKSMELMIAKKEYKYDQIKAKENEYGGIVDKEIEKESGKYMGNISYSRFKTKGDDNPLKYRTYFFDWDDDTEGEMLGTAEEIMYTYHPIDLCFYKDDIEDSFLITKEFRDLLKKEGYVFSRYFRGVVWLENKKDNTEIALRGLIFNDLSIKDYVATINIRRKN